MQRLRYSGMQISTKRRQTRALEIMEKVCSAIATERTTHVTVAYKLQATIILYSKYQESKLLGQ